MTTFTLLIVEDNEEVLNSYERGLTFLGYKILSANNGQKALELLKSLKSFPDLIISDIEMEDVSGFSLFKRLVNNPRLVQIPFIFVTALSDSETIRLAKGLGVDDILIKPVKMADLLPVIEGKLRRVNIRKDIEMEIQENYFQEESKKQAVDKRDITLFYAIWDPKKGPVIKTTYPPQQENEFKIPLDRIVTHFFQGFKKIQDNSSKGVLDTLITIPRMDKHAFIRFLNEGGREGENVKRQALFGMIAPSISYLQSLHLKNLLTSFFEQTKANNKMSLENVYDQVQAAFKLEAKEELEL